MTHMQEEADTEPVVLDYISHQSQTWPTVAHEHLENRHLGTTALNHGNTVSRPKWLIYFLSENTAREHGAWMPVKECTGSNKGTLLTIVQ